MRKFALLAAVGALLTLTGCAAYTISPLPGALYADVKYPSYYDGVQASGPGVRTGTAQAASILGIIATGDASVAAACRNGGIKKIATVDHHVTNILGVYTTWTTVVTGE